MSSSEESQWLVDSGVGLASLGGKAPTSAAGEHSLVVRGCLYTEEMTTQPAKSAAANVNVTLADLAEHDLIDSNADVTLLAQFHEDAIKQVPCKIHSTSPYTNLLKFPFN